jgi:hypothetical protein
MHEGDHTVLSSVEVKNEWIVHPHTQEQVKLYLKEAIIRDYKF